MSESLKDAFLDELKDAYDAEKQLTKALPKMAKATTSPELRTAFESHLEETRAQIDRLEQVFQLLGEKGEGQALRWHRRHHRGGQRSDTRGFDEQTMDAVLIASGQRAEHYEMAAYGTLVAWANVLGHADAGKLLESILQEEKAADAKLTKLAAGGINQQAADVGKGDEEDEEEEESLAKAKTNAGAAKRR